MPLGPLQASWKRAPNGQEHCNVKDVCRMNRFKKFLAGALAACMALALPLNALAAQPLTRGEEIGRAHV